MWAAVNTRVREEHADQAGPPRAGGLCAHDRVTHSTERTQLCSQPTLSESHPATTAPTPSSLKSIVTKFLL